MPRNPADPVEEEGGYRWRESVRKSGAKSRRRLFSPDRVPKEIVDRIRAMLDPENPASADLRCFPPNNITCSLDDLSLLPEEPDLSCISYSTEPTPLLDSTPDSDEDGFIREQKKTEVPSSQRRLFGEGLKAHDDLHDDLLEGVEPLELQSRSSSPKSLVGEASDMFASDDQFDVIPFDSYQQRSAILIAPPNSPVDYFEEASEGTANMDSMPGSLSMENLANLFQEGPGQENQGLNTDERGISGSKRKNDRQASGPSKDRKPKCYRI